MQTPNTIFNFKHFDAVKLVVELIDIIYDFHKNLNILVKHTKKCALFRSDYDYIFTGFILLALILIDKLESFENEKYKTINFEKAF